MTKCRRALLEAMFWQDRTQIEITGQPEIAALPVDDVALAFVALECDDWIEHDRSTPPVYRLTIEGRDALVRTKYREWDKEPVGYRRCLCGECECLMDHGDRYPLCINPRCPATPRFFDHQRQRVVADVLSMQQHGQEEDHEAAPAINAERGKRGCSIQPPAHPHPHPHHAWHEG